MKKFLLGAFGLAALSMASPASAADLAARPYTKAPAFVAAIYDWSGFYIGANGGYGSSRKCWDVVNPNGTFGAEGCHNATGAVAGGQVGYRWQSGAWVFGLEGQGDWANLRGSNVSAAFTRFSNRSSIDAFGLFTGQVGYSWNNALLYVKGGGAVVSDKYSSVVIFNNALSATASETRWGGTVGVGLEYGFAPNWSAAVEYDRLFLGNRNLNFVAPNGAPTVTDRIRQDVDVVTARVNYRWGGPVVAKY